MKNFERTRTLHRDKGLRIKRRRGDICAFIATTHIVCVIWMWCVPFSHVKEYLNNNTFSIISIYACVLFLRSFDLCTECSLWTSLHVTSCIVPVCVCLCVADVITSKGCLLIILFTHSLHRVFHRQDMLIEYCNLQLWRYSHAEMPTTKV